MGLLKPDSPLQATLERIYAKDVRYTMLPHEPRRAVLNGILDDGRPHGKAGEAEEPAGFETEAVSICGQRNDLL